MENDIKKYNFDSLTMVYCKDGGESVKDLTYKCNEVFQHPYDMSEYCTLKFFLGRKVRPDKDPNDEECTKLLSIESIYIYNRSHDIEEFNISELIDKGYRRGYAYEELSGILPHIIKRITNNKDSHNNNILFLSNIQSDFEDLSTFKELLIDIINSLPYIALHSLKQEIDDIVVCCKDSRIRSLFKNVGFRYLGKTTALHKNVKGDHK